VHLGSSTNFTGNPTFPGLETVQGILCDNSVVLSAKRQAIMGFAAVFLLSFLIVLAFTPHIFDSHAGLRQNESAAVGSLRRIHDLQTKYAASRPNEGFACDLQRLRPVENVTSAYDPTKNLLSGEWSGYKFVLTGCTPTKRGVVVRYEITAVPSAPGLTGVRAFCADESGTVFYAENGSASECLSSRVSLF
jgi:hypothetical protein